MTKLDYALALLTASCVGAIAYIATRPEARQRRKTMRGLRRLFSKPSVFEIDARSREKAWPERLRFLG